MTQEGDEMNEASIGNYAEVNGLAMCYEVHGSGEPLVLLHGGGAIEMFGGVLPLLAEGRQVIAVDLQAHGRTADIDRPLSYESMAESRRSPKIGRCCSRSWAGCSGKTTTGRKR
jgi:pimeloyl-ACP methyl ester carboxylesterase